MGVLGDPGKLDYYEEIGCTEVVLRVNGAPEGPTLRQLDQLAHLDWERDGEPDVYQAPPCQYLGGEPVFVADPDEPRAGVVICPTFDAAQQTSAFAVFGARRVARGPVARVRLRRPIHLGFHAAFQPAGRGGPDVQL